ncbi:MAG: hypothetical protein OXU23_14320 [Candidatus Poribacteria bacterium]|nr:hypothetical protein [Candidatus Poribacteria bacterium]
MTPKRDNQTSGSDYTGGQSFYDTAVHNEYVDGDDRLGSIAKSWIENLQDHHNDYASAAAKIWL